ncbi:unnamed protein product, partial [Iphiclides podalirius]
MECGRLNSGMRWSAYSFTSSKPCIPSVVIEDCDSEHSDPSAVTNNFLRTYPEDDNEGESLILNKQLSKSIEDSNEANGLTRLYENPPFISEGVLNDEISKERGAEELMKSEAKKFQDYKFCEAVNDFDIELEGGEAVPIVYLSTTRAAKLQRALRLAGLKKHSRPALQLGGDAHD